ncbi:MAG: ABC transporter permease [Verrucomicrobiota bacterium]|nr:ABC transporter permease [Verrucomicrobiota bacterium]
MKTKERKPIIIRANQAWWRLNLKELIQSTDLIYLLIRRDLVTSYKQTILGPLWIVIQSLMGSAVFTVVFGKIAGLSTDGHPTFLFYLCGTLAWQYFGTVFGLGSNSLQSNLPLFSKVYFHRMIPPLGQAISSLINFVIQLIVFFLALGIYLQANPDSAAGPQFNAFLLPLLVFQSAILGLGLGFIISAASVKYRDLGRLAGLFTQFLMYATPVIYPVSEIPMDYRPYLAWNPLTFIVESFRNLLLGHSTASTLEYAIPSILSTLVIFVLGLIIYNKTQRTYVDYV